MTSGDSTDEFTWCGEYPEDLYRWARSRVGPGKLTYVWGGGGWRVSLFRTVVDSGSTLVYDPSRRTIRLKEQETIA